MKNYRYTLLVNKVVACSAIILAFFAGIASSAELPVLHMRKALAPPPLVTKLQTPSEASAWYSSSPTWFGLGGLTGDKNHTEVLATYDDTALYVAFLNIDRSLFVCPQNTIVPLNTVDANAIWIETPEGRRLYFMMSLDSSYPPKPRRASGDISSYDRTADRLQGWSHTGWYATNKTLQQMVRIPWSTMGTSAPAQGSRWRVNFVNYNQVTVAGPNLDVMWAPGNKWTPGQWGTLAFDEGAFPAPSGISPEATLTLRPASGYGEEVTLQAGNKAAETNVFANEAVTQSNWNDWDPIDYTLKEYMQFDLSMIPPDRTIISAVLSNHYRSNYESDPTPLYLHAVRLESEYDPETVTMLTSPRPVENGYRRLVQLGEKSNWVEFDVTDMLAKARSLGQGKLSLALAGSSGDVHNGKIWDVSFGRADYYDKARPKLVVTFGRKGVSYPSPVSVGSSNYTSVATARSKNKLTNGTFSYGEVEGITNSTYWGDPGYAYVNGVNMPYMALAGDVNPNTGHTALRFMTPKSWKCIRQIATGLAGGRSYTFSGWYKSAVSGHRADVRITFQDANGNALGSMQQAAYSGSGKWEKVKLTRTSPSGTAKALVELYNWNSGAGAYMLYSDLQLEEGSSATAYAETMGIYYPDYPRVDGTTL